MAFKVKRATLSIKGQKSRAMGRAAFSLGRKAHDPSLKQRERLKKQLIAMNAKIKKKYSGRARSMVR